MEFNSFGPAVGRLGSDSSRGPNSAKVEAGGLTPALAPLTLTTGERLCLFMRCRCAGLVLSLAVVPRPISAAHSRQPRLGEAARSGGVGHVGSAGTRLLAPVGSGHVPTVVLPRSIQRQSRDLSAARSPTLGRSALSAGEIFTAQRYVC